MTNPNDDTEGCVSGCSTMIAAICLGIYANSWLVGLGVFFALVAVWDAALMVTSGVRLKR